MKNILRDSLGRFRSLKINLLDGQRRGEIVFRRVFLLIVLYILFILVGHLIFPKAKQEEVVQEVEAKERVEWVNGDRVTYREDGVVEVVPAENFESAEVVEVEVVETGGKGVDSVGEFIKSYGGRIDDTYLALLRNSCSEEALKIVVAISVAESSMGKGSDKQANFFGWFKDGNRNYDPSVEEMATEICRGVQKGYMNIADPRVAEVYTGGDRTDNWLRNFNWALAQM